MCNNNYNCFRQWLHVLWLATVYGSMHTKDTSHAHHTIHVRWMMYVVYEKLNCNSSLYYNGCHRKLTLYNIILNLMWLWSTHHLQLKQNLGDLHITHTVYVQYVGDTAAVIVAGANWYLIVALLQFPSEDNLSNVQYYLFWASCTDISSHFGFITQSIR